MNRPIDFRSLAPILERATFILLVLLSLTFAFEWIEPLVGLNGLVVTNVEALLFLIVGLWLLTCLTAGRWPRAPRILALPVIAWLGVMLVSALAAPSHRVEALKFFGRMVGGVLIGWAVYDLTDTPGRWRTMVRALALSGLVVAGFGLTEAAGFPVINRFLEGFKLAPTVAGDVPRLSSTLGYATIASMVLELTTPLILAWTLTARRSWMKVLLGVGLLAALAAQVLTLTRSGVIALLAAFSLIGAWAVLRRQRTLLIGTLAATGIHLAMIGMVFVTNPLTKLRLASESEQSWYRATYQAPARLTVEAGETTRVPIKLTNTGVRTWHADGSDSFRLGYHLTQPDGSMVDFDSPRTVLPQDVPPGSSVEVQAHLSAPDTAGEYIVEWDMLQENVTWFSHKGTSTSRTELTVIGTVADNPPRQPISSGPEETVLQAPGRIELWKIAGVIIQVQPLLGVGPDNFRWVYGSYVGYDRWDTRYHTNNLYIEWLVNTGVLGLLAFLWLVWRLVRLVYRRLFAVKSDAESTIWYLALAGGLTAWFVHGVFDHFYEFTPTYVAFWLIVGLVAAESSVSREDT